MSKAELKQIKTIVVATGLTSESVGGVVMAREVAERLGAKLHAVHVIEPISEAAESAVPGLAEAHDQQAMEELERFAEDYGIREGVKLHVRRGEAEVEVLKAAKELKADLMVVGRYGKGGLKRDRLGSVADRIVRKSPVSVLVAQPEYRGGLERIGVATAFSEECEVIVNRGAELAQVLGLKEVHLLHAYELPLGYHRVMSEEDVKEKIEALGQKRTKVLQDSIGSQYGDVTLVLHQKEGQARGAVPKMVEEAQIGLLVVGTHGRSGIAMYMLNRTTEALINRCNCSIWAAKQPEWYQGFIKALGELMGG